MKVSSRQWKLYKEIGTLLDTELSTKSHRIEERERRVMLPWYDLVSS